MKVTIVGPGKVGMVLAYTPECRVLSERAKYFGMEVFHKKGNTCYAIGQSAAKAVRGVIDGLT